MRETLPEIAYSGIDRDLIEIAKMFDNVTYINPLKTLCTDNICPLVIDGKLVYKNNNHLNIHGADLILNDAFLELGIRNE